MLPEASVRGRPVGGGGGGDDNHHIWCNGTLDHGSTTWLLYNSSLYCEACYHKPRQ